jgi:hypothetical protein
MLYMYPLLFWVTCGENSMQACMGYYRLAVGEFDRGNHKKSAFVIPIPTPFRLSFAIELTWH